MTSEERQRADGRAWKREDARHHDREAPRYDALIGREFAPYQRLHTGEPWARLLAEDGARLVLDAGCGTGRTTMPLARSGVAVIAADPSRGMLRLAVAKARAAGLGDRVLPLVADAERLPLADGAVDGVVCQGVLHHLPEPARALGELDRVARRGAWLLLAEPDVEASAPARAVRGALRLAGRLPRPARWRSPAAERERPLAPEALLEPLAALGYRPSATYLRHPPLLYRWLPESVSTWAARVLNVGDAGRRRPADILVLRARKEGRAR